MQLNFTVNTDDQSEVVKAIKMLQVFAPPAPTPAPSQSVPAPSGPVSNFPPIPPGAPAGASWSAMPGAPALVDANGLTIATDWSDPKNPKIAPPPVYTPEELAQRELARQAGENMMESLGLKPRS
jgi:hypothetical protein